MLTYEKAAASCIEKLLAGTESVSSQLMWAVCKVLKPGVRGQLGGTAKTIALPYFIYPGFGYEKDLKPPQLDRNLQCNFPDLGQGLVALKVTQAGF